MRGSLEKLPGYKRFAGLDVFCKKKDKTSSILTENI